MEKLQKFNENARKSAKQLTLNAGDIVRVSRKIKEGGKERIQVFEGIIVSIKGRQSSSPMATVRRISFGTGVEITIPLYSPSVSKIEIVKQAKVRRAKLYYLRKKGFRVSKLKTKELADFVAEEPARIATPASSDAASSGEQNVAGGKKQPEPEIAKEEEKPVQQEESPGNKQGQGKKEEKK